SLFAVQGISASALSDDYWTDSGNYDISWYDSSDETTSYTLSSVAELAGVAYLVNSGTTDFSGVTLTLSTSIDLSAHYWYPIGGVSTLSSSGIPGGYYFAGTFNGNNETISGLYIQYISGNSGYGLFGCVQGGSIANVTLSTGAVNVGTNSVSAIGALVGYTNGDVYNCHNQKVEVYMGNTSASQCGGLIGT
ncbi:MAG: hypothetical protein LUB63_06260, partial [Oscillospiraceae bacterium]|nr:hypothetical protein [Oscillospiraceae bacterium]